MVIETKTAKVYIKDDIVFLIYRDKADVGVDEIKENLKVKTELQKGVPMKTLVDVRNIWQYSDEAREVVSSEEFKKITIAMALVVGYSLPVKMIANFFMKINKPKTPTKLFKNKESAMKWLLDYTKNTG